MVEKDYLTTAGYNFPVWFWDTDVTDEERSEWMTQERCRRQALRQDTPWARHMEKLRDREQRRLKAHPDTVDVTEYR